MVEYFKKGVYYATDKLGDGLIKVLDEVKFWGEVIVEFMELDQTSSDRHLEDVRQQVREQIDETQEYMKEVEEIKKARGIVDEDSDDDGKTGDLEVEQQS